MLLAAPSYAKDKDSTNQFNSISLIEDKIHWERLAMVGTGTLVLNTTLWLYYDEAWYAGDKVKFHSVNDWYNEKLNIDKLEHLWGALSLYRISYHLLKWSNLSEHQAMWYSSAAAWLLQLQIELSDGQYKQWGFSWWDLTFNTFGVLYPHLQKEVPLFNSINFKFSYTPSHGYKDGLYKYYIDDYEGKTIWLSISVADFLPAQLKKFYPGWLNLAVGYGGENLLNAGCDKTNYNGGDQQWLIALDYDLVKIFNPDKNTFFYGLLDCLNLIHFPSPAIQIKPDGIFYGFYF
jgi:hypothetical protein